MKRLALLCLAIPLLYTFPGKGFSAGANNLVGEPLQFQSPFLRIELAPDQPALVTLAVDSLGKGKLAQSALRPPSKTAGAFQVRRDGQRVEYRPAGAPATAPPAWAFEFSAEQMRLRSSYSGGTPPPPLVLNFNPHLCHATLLGLMQDGNYPLTRDRQSWENRNEGGRVLLPALLHLPDYGTFRITSTAAPGLALGYDALRGSDALRGLATRKAGDYVEVTFPGASEARPAVEYTLEVVAIYPHVPGIEGDPRFDGFRRNWLNIFQLNPRTRMLANHAASDPVAPTVYEYSMLALQTPPLAPNLTALDMVRQTLDRYLRGTKGWGMAGYLTNLEGRYDLLDTYPSLVIAAWDYVRGSKDEAWLGKNYAGLKGWATKMLATDRDGSGLLEYPLSGNSGSWPAKLVFRPANAYDTIGFGHQDAYSNALAYHALQGMADLARRAKKPDDARYYASRAEKLRSVYFNTFYNPATGVLAGWKSADGKLHDYYFTWVNGVAITYGLVPREKANQIMDRLLAKMKEVGYTHFEYGLPGNLIPIRRADYVHLVHRWGGPEKEDGSDGFQIYTNGGATAVFAYFTIEALYKLGHHKEADAILFPMLHAFEEGNFQGVGPNGMTYDWKTWDGTPHGYEGLLVDGYLALLAVLSR